MLGGSSEVARAIYEKLIDSWMDANTLMVYFASLKAVWKVFPSEKPLDNNLFSQLLKTNLSYTEFYSWIASHA